jgi:biotin operon repressor
VGRSLVAEKLRGRDSNPDFPVQSRADCHYPTPQRWGRIAVSGRATRSRRMRTCVVQNTREQVASLLEGGVSQAEIGRRLGRSKATIAYHARQLGWPVDERCNRRYDWTQVQRFHDEGHSVTECQREFGFARCTWTDAVRRGKLTPRSHLMPIEVLLGGVRNRNHI